MGDDGIESEGPSADSALTLDFGPATDPATGSDDTTQLSVVWQRSDLLRQYLNNKGAVSKDDRRILKAYLIAQLPTLFVYWQMEVFLKALANHTAPTKTVSLYILLFPGEARDNTGIKDLNDKVIGQWWNSQFIQARFQIIQTIFEAPDPKTSQPVFNVAAQTYKTAYILTYDRTRKDFVAKLIELDSQLRVKLLEILDQAEKSAAKEQKAQIAKLRKALKSKKYRFDFYFGLRELKPAGNSRLETTYLLITEALKGAAIARYVAKANALGRYARQIAAQAGISPDARKLDPRGKEYDWKVYMRASNMAETLKALFVGGTTQSSPYSLNEIYVDTVWTFAFQKRKNLYWGNPDTIRDVRKKKLESAPISKGNMTYGFPIQRDLLELWLVILNMLDYIKRFKFDEFGKELLVYHDAVLEVFVQLGTEGVQLDWQKFEKIVTHDVRQQDAIAVFESASEFQFYCAVSDYQQRIFFTMDIRDMGVELMLDYEHSNREIGHQKYSDIDLMQETFRASDPIDARRRVTYDTVVAVFLKYYKLLAKGSGAASTAAQQAFAGNVDPKLGSFPEAVQIMLGGDEVYVATHPLFAQYVPTIIGELDKASYLPGRTIDMRCSTALSSAKTVGTGQRLETQLSHQEAMKLAELAPGTLKEFERTRRRIERLIDVIEWNPKKKARGPGYRQELDAIPLKQLYARLKNKAPQRLTPANFAKLLAVLQAEDLDGAENRPEFELVDFNGKIVEQETSRKAAQALEDKVRRDVGRDNVRVQPPPAYNIPTKLPKWVEDLIDIWYP